MTDFTADNVIVTNCDPSELSAFLPLEENDLLLEPFGEELPLTSRDAKIKAEDVGSFIEAQKKQNTKAATARDIKNVHDGYGKIRGNRSPLKIFYLPG